LSKIINTDWSNKEVELIISDYFSMLGEELQGKPYNKTSHRNYLIPLLNNRSHRSIDFKHQNITAVLIKLGLPYIKGYKPMRNYQRLLEEKTIAFLSNQKIQLEPKFNEFVESNSTLAIINDFSQIIDSPPEKKVAVEPSVAYRRRPIKINYLEREQNNISLGEKGETLVLEYEKWNLIRLGKDSLAEKIEWVSKTDDGAGFDILSKNINGTDKYIEVKTTKLCIEFLILHNLLKFFN